jgi:hypothetical protein
MFWYIGRIVVGDGASLSSRSSYRNAYSMIGRSTFSDGVRKALEKVLKVGDMMGDMMGDMIGDRIGESIGERIGVGMSSGDSVGSFTTSTLFERMLKSDSCLSFSFCRNDLFVLT